jgi:hypothetical protein
MRQNLTISKQQFSKDILAALRTSKIFLALPFRERDDRHRVPPRVVVDFGKKLFGDGSHLSRRDGAGAVEAAQEANHGFGRLQLGLVHVEIHAVKRFEFERDVLVNDIRNGAW